MRFFKIIKAYFFWRLKLTLASRYLEQVSHDALVEPSNIVEEEVEEMLTNSMKEAVDELEIDPITILAAGPMLRQRVAGSLAKILKDKTYQKETFKRCLDSLNEEE